jgi:serine/threonine protein kinase
MLINEIEVMKNLDHPNIIRLYETFRSKPSKLNQLICLYETYSDQANDKLHLAKP